MSAAGDRLGRLLLIQGDSPSPLEDELLRLDVLARRIPSSLSVNTVYECGLADGREAFHKPHDGMREHPLLKKPLWQRFGHPSAAATGINECAAWRLARAMGPPWDTLVPTAVMRWLPHEAALVGGWGPLVRKGNGPSGRQDPFRRPELCLPAAFFDALIGQQDRHMGNQRYEPATGRLTLIDHGFAFPGGRWHFRASEFVTQRQHDRAAALSTEELDALRRLPELPVWEELELILSPDQIAALEWRRAGMLESRQLLEARREAFAGQ